MSTNSKWYVYAKRADFQGIAARFGIDPVIARVLRNRDLITDEEIRYFLKGTLEDLYDEGLIPDMDRAANALLQAVRDGRRIRIVGDYDIDGVCATYILLQGLKALGATVDHRIPDRINDGYGINRSIVEQAAADGIELILTCDNGIAAIDELKLAKELGLAVIVTDHHNVRADESGADVLPEALAVVNVKRTDSSYPTEDTCGAVTAWKLIRRLYRLFGMPEDAWLNFLEFAAIATVGDIMKLTGENRIIVKEGLKRISRGSRNIGLRALVDALELTGKDITTYHVGFMIGPCINAGGRLESAESALKLFLCQDPQEAEILAGHLRLLNAERKSMTEEGTKRGIALVEAEHTEDRVLVVYLEGLHESLAGIVAGRLKEYFYRPCFVLTDAKDGLKGSGRSIEGYDMFAALCNAEHCLSKYGGHKMAAGISLPKEKLTELRRVLNEQAELSEDTLTKKRWIDDPTPLSYIYEGFIEALEALAPFGPGFERPMFAARDIRITDAKVLGKARNVLKLRLKDRQGAFYDGILFGEADELSRELVPGVCVDILYTPKLNEFRGRRTIQIEIADFRPSAARS